MGDALARYFVIENEDDLTRIVFGILELLGPSVLAAVLDIPSQTFSDDVTVEFHERIHPRADRVPDVLITDSDVTVMIEAKRGTDFNPNQLRDEHEDLRQFGNEQKRLVLISGHESSPARLEEVEVEFLDWLGWEDIVLQISRFDGSELSETQHRLIALLNTILEEEGYLPFTGFSERLFEEFPAARDLLEHYRKQLARFHRAIEAQLADSGLQAKSMWRDGISQKASHEFEWLVNSCSPPAHGSEHVVLQEKLELKVLEQRDRLRSCDIQEPIDRSYAGCDFCWTQFSTLHHLMRTIL